MEAIKRGDYAAALALSSTEFQTQIGDVEGLQNILSGRGFFPDTWNFHDRIVETETGRLQGSVTLTSGRRMGIVLDFSKVDGAWRVSRIEFINS